MTGVQNESWWVASTQATAFPPHAGEPTAEVAVLGGGIAGLTTAYLLAKEGRDVLLVEAARIAEGVSGYTTAKVTVQHSLIYADLESRHGAEAARTYADSQSAALQWIRDTVAREGIECELESVASLVYTESEDERSKVDAEVMAAVAAGLDARLVADADLPYGFVAGARMEGQAQFHPRKYLLALAATFVAAGGRIVEQTRALDVGKGSPCVVTTEHGTIRADQVVVATHYPFLDRGGLFARLAPYRDVVVAAPVPAASAPQLIAISTGAEEGGVHSVRTAPYRDGERLLVITGGQYKTGTTSEVEVRYDGLEAWATERFGVSNFAYRWSAQDTSSVDRLPYIGKLPLSGDNVFVATGFSAWGMTNGTLSGMVLADLLAGRDNPWAALYDPSRADVRASASKGVKEGASVAKEMVGGMFRRYKGSADDVAPGQAAVYRGPGGRTAAYREKDGTLHCVSAKCTHMGCTVAWNDAERSWDCPCHGSRFDHTGAVLQGPAVKPLGPVEP
ncbi:MAG TPA: FAD-dependent oxidoreductase [Mycobacteriales bacterium]|nr:FAD-dependent oxidoreductase [Mycobacteriales bacterium]